MTAKDKFKKHSNHTLKYAKLYPQTSRNRGEKTKTLNKAEHGKIVKCCRFGLIEPFMNGTGKCKLSSTP
jgi:hypothetical protein